jgi:hypothetical protein
MSRLSSRDMGNGPPADESDELGTTRSWAAQGHTGTALVRLRWFMSGIRQQRKAHQSEWDVNITYARGFRESEVAVVVVVVEIGIGAAVEGVVDGGISWTGTLGIGNAWWQVAM